MSETFNIHEAKTHLSKIVDRVVNGDEIIIARAGKPLVKVVPLKPRSKKRKLGPLAGQAVITGDFKKDFAEEIEEMFYGELRHRSPE